MTCQRHTAALIDLAASGSQPSAELRAHLQSCPSCRSAFQRERQLFASIDESLRASANAEVPAAFVQRVSARLNQQAAVPRVSFLRPRIVFAVAAAAIILSVVAYSNRRPRFTSEETSIAQRQSSSGSVLPKPPASAGDSFSRRVTASNVEARSSKTLTGNLQQSSPSAPRDPEILVSGEQEILLARYAEQLRHRSSLPVLASVPTPAPASNSEVSQTPALQFSPIQIAQLDVKPLAERQE